MSYVVQKSVAHSVPVKLTDDDDFKTQVTGKTGGNVTVRYKKYGDSSWSTKDVSGSGWDEIGNGCYEVDFSADDLNTAGRFDYQVECSGCLDYNGSVLVVNHNPLTIQQHVSGYFKVMSHLGNSLASESDLQLLMALSLIEKLPVTAEGSRTTTSAYLEDGGPAYFLSVGDRIVWNHYTQGQGSKPWHGVITTVDGNQVTWTPPLAEPPNVDDHAYILRNETLMSLHDVAVPDSPTTGSVNERVKAIDDKLPSGDISDYDEYRCCANVGYDGSTLTVNAWLEHQGQLVTEPTSCTVTVFDDAGSQQFEVSDNSPDAQGVFKMTKASPGLAAGMSYYARIQIVASGSTYTTIEGVATL